MVFYGDTGFLTAPCNVLRWIVLTPSLRSILSEIYLILQKRKCIRKNQHHTPHHPYCSIIILTDQKPTTYTLITLCESLALCLMRKSHCFGERFNINFLLLPCSTITKLEKWVCFIHKRGSFFLLQTFAVQLQDQLQELNWGKAWSKDDNLFCVK